MDAFARSQFTGAIPRNYGAPEGELLPPQRGGYDDYAHPPVPQPPPPRQRRGFAMAPATYILLSINIGVFVLMLVSGVSPLAPTPEQMLHWGANIGYADYMGYGELGFLHDQWWRLVTAMFVHVGAIHLATNMWCLWNLGLLGEQLVGTTGLLSIYLLTGAAGNLLSTTVNSSSIGAGASGAVFGIAGLLIVLLSNKGLPVPPQELNRLRRSVIFFAVINFIIGYSAGFAPIGIRIDNSAHLGGCLCGLVLGLALLPFMLQGRKKYLARQRVVFTAAAFVLALFGYWIANFRRG